MEDPLRIGRHAAIPLSEIELRTSRSSGPGGQHANVTASRVEAVFDVCGSPSLTGEQRDRIAARLGPVVRAVAQDTRSQSRNRELALERLRGRLEGALAVRASAPRNEAQRRLEAAASGVEAPPRRGEAAAGSGRRSELLPWASRRCRAAALALGLGGRGLRGRLAALRRRRPAAAWARPAWRWCRRCRPSRAGCWA